MSSPIHLSLYCPSSWPEHSRDREAEAASGGEKGEVRLLTGSWVLLRSGNLGGLGSKSQWPFCSLGMGSGRSLPSAWRAGGKEPGELPGY